MSTLAFDATARNFRPAGSARPTLPQGYFREEAAAPAGLTVEVLLVAISQKGNGR